MDRRTYLKSAGAALGSCVLATTGVTAIDYDRTVNIVEAGADPTGGRPIDDVFQEVARDGTLVEFPEGEYLANSLSLWGLENFGIRATGDATLVPSSADNDDDWIAGSDTRNLLIEGFTFDTTEDGVSPTVAISCHDGLIVRDVLKRGPQNDGSTAFSFRIVEVDGSGLIENLRAPDGDTSGDAVGLFTNTTGTLTVRDCRIEEFGNNGLYASGSDGPVQVEGGFFRNNDVSSVRLGSPGSYVKSADFVVSDPSKDDGNYRAVRVSDGPGPVTIEDVDIHLESGQGSGGVVCAYSGGSFDLRNSRIRVDSEYSIVGTDDITGHAVAVDDASGVDDPGERTIQNLSVTGGGDQFPAIDIKRGNNTVEGSQIQQSGDGRDGINVASESTNNDVLNCAIEVTGRQITGDGEVHVENMTDDADPEEVSVDVDGDFDAGTDADADSSSDTDADSDAEAGSDGSSGATTTPSTPSETGTSDETPTPTSEEAETDAPVRAQPRDEVESSAGVKQPGYPISSPEDETYATMGTTDDAPTVTVWSGFKCSSSAKFAMNNLQAIVDELVRSGDVRVRHRTLPYDFDDPDFPGIEADKGGVLAAEYGLGVWEVDPDSYWSFYHHLYEKLLDGQWANRPDLNEFMREAGVENRDTVRARVEDGRYHPAVRKTTERAAELGITLVPRISFRGETISARRDTDTVLEWIRDRV